jgi:hypothetical protein
MTQTYSLNDTLKAGATAIALALPVVAGAAALTTMLTTSAEAQSRGGASPTGGCGGCGPGTSTDGGGGDGGPDDIYDCRYVANSFFRSGGNRYANVTIYPVDPNGTTLSTPTATGQIRTYLNFAFGATSFLRSNVANSAERAVDICDGRFVSVGVPTTTTTGTPVITSVTTPRPTAPVYVYNLNTYITTNRGATGACEAAFDVLSEIKRSTPTNVRVDPVLRVGEDYSQFSATDVAAMNDCSVYGVIDRRGRACAFDFDDVRGGELFAEGGICPARTEEQTNPEPEPEVIAPAEPEENTNGSCVAVVAHEKGLRNDGDVVIASWENPNDNSIFTVEHDGLNDVLGFDCDNDPELEYFATTSVDIAQAASLLEKGDNGQYVGITSAVANFELVKEEHAPASICPQTVEQMCTSNGFTPRLDRN